MCPLPLLKPHSINDPKIFLATLACNIRHVILIIYCTSTMSQTT